MPPRIHYSDVDGAGLLVIEDRALPLVRFAIALDGGAGFDPAGEAGVTRTTLELMLRGTESRDRAAYADALEELGSSLWALVGHEYAMLRGSTLRRELVPTFALLQEAVLTPAFASDELERLVEESVDELRTARDDDDVVADLFLRQAIYEGHPFARSPAGEVADLRRIDGTAVRAAYNRLWRRSQLRFAFAGDIDVETARALVQPLVARLPATALATPTVPPLLDVPRPTLWLVDKPERTQVQLRLAKLVCAGTEAAALPFWLGSVAFGGTFTSPFTTEVRDRRGWSYVAHASYDRRRLYRSPLVLRSAPAVGDAVACLGLELDLYDGLRRGVLDAEVASLARDYLLGRYPFDIATAADMLVPALREVMLGESPDNLFTLPERLGAVDVAGLGAVMQGQLAGSGYVGVLVAEASALHDELRKTFPAADLRVVDFRDGLDLEASP